ncbi:MAG: anti-sigma factor [Pseudomonadota bacterium]
MSEQDDIKRDDPMLAAEFSLGLLEGEELLTARGKLASDPEFAARKEWWDNWFAPWTDEVAGAEPSAEVWDHIAARVLAASEGSGATGAQVIELQSLKDKVRRWQWTAGITSAAAAVALAFLAFPSGTPGTDPQPTPTFAAADPLVATIPIGDTALRLDVTYIPESERMLVAAIGLTPDGVHDHELWLVPADGSALQSLGVVAPGEVRSVDLPGDITRNMGDGVELVLTREPIGGKPEGVDAGPVVAQGALSQV